AAQGPPPARGPAPRGGLPLSFAQQRLWYLDRLRPGDPAYHIAAAVNLAGPLDVAAFAGSVSEIVRRHEVRRTTFAASEGWPVQAVGAPGPTATPVVDLSGLAAARE